MKQHQMTGLLNAAAVLILLIVFGLMAVFVNSNERRETEELQRQLAQKTEQTEAEHTIHIVDYTGPAGPSADTSTEQLLTFADWKAACLQSGGPGRPASVAYSFPTALNGDRLYLLQFKLRSDSACIQFQVDFGGGYTYYASTQWHMYSIPCIGQSITGIEWELPTGQQQVYLSDVQVFACDPACDIRRLQNGSYLLEEKETVIDVNEGLGLGPSSDLIVDGDTLYSLREEQLVISRITPTGVETISTVDNLGNLRHLAQKDPGVLAVAARENGVYLIDVSDKEHPRIASYYDPLEIVNDVAFSGDYMFLASRYFGVEIVDVSDLTHPEYVTGIVNGKECYRCCVDGTNLFISCWATRDVEIYNISTIDQPRLIAAAPVDGRCGEAAVADGFLYIATGYSAASDANTPGGKGYGTGNGITIYNIEDCASPVWCATIKTDGSLFEYSNDDWNVQVSGGYAYYTDSFHGVYIFDVSDPCAPIQVRHITVPIPGEHPAYRDFTRNEQAAFPYDPAEYIVSPAMGVCVADGAVWFSGAYSDVYRFDFSAAQSIRQKTAGVDYHLAGVEPVRQRGISVQYTDYDMYSLCVCGNLLAAAHNGGLLLLDSDLNVVDSYDTPNPVRDVKATAEGRLVTAEKTGVGVYQISGGRLEQTVFVPIDLKNRNISQIALTGDGRFALVQASWQYAAVLDLRDSQHPVWLDTVMDEQGVYRSLLTDIQLGNMYYHNLVNGTMDGAVGIAGSINALWLYSTGEGVAIKQRYPNRGYGESNGDVVVCSDMLLSVYNNGYMLYNPASVPAEGAFNAPRYSVTGVRVKGKPAICGDRLLVSNMPGRSVMALDISDPKSPVLNGSALLPGSPGLAAEYQGSIFLPLRHGGIAEISI